MVPGAGFLRWLGLLRPVQFVVALRRLRVDPEDGVEGVRLFYAAGGEDDFETLARMKRSPEGQRILDAREPIQLTAGNRDCLRTLPPGTLGRAVAEFFDAEAISAEGLVASTTTIEPAPRSPEHAFFRDRSRDVHDILHVLTGYGRDILGEIALHGFTYAQYGNRAYGFLGAMSCLAALLFLRRWDAPGVFLEGHRRGRRAPFLPAVDWNAAMGDSLDELRERFHLGAPPRYVPLASREVAA